MIKTYREIILTEVRNLINLSNSVNSVNHSGLLGRFRELFLSKFITSYLDPGLDLCNGQIIDSKGNQSKEIDIILYNPSSCSF